MTRTAIRATAMMISAVFRLGSGAGAGIVGHGAGGGIAFPQLGQYRVPIATSVKQRGQDTC